jgi:hypothetical protein
MRELTLNPNQVLSVVSDEPDVLVIESHWLAGNEHGPPAHFHPEQEEHFEILEGEIEVKLGGETSIVRAGDTVDVPVGAVHEMRPLAETRARWEVRPPLRTLALFERLAEMTRTNDFSPAAEVLVEFEREFRLA